LGVGAFYTIHLSLIVGGLDIGRHGMLEGRESYARALPVSLMESLSHSETIAFLAQV
jgi:hypothetical protein